MQHNRIFSTEDAFHPDIQKMPQHSGWYISSQPEDIPIIAEQQATRMCDLMAALPQGKRVVFLRGVLRYESYSTAGADPMYLFENGGVKLSRSISMLRPLGRELRRRGMHLDGVWTDNEGGATTWSIPYETLLAVLRSPKARSKMPPGVRALREEMFGYGHPNYRNAIVTFNRWAELLMYRSLRGVMVTSGIFCSPPSGGGAPEQPPTGNFNVSAPTWPVFDYNGWPIFSFSLDGRTSSPSCYLTYGNRHTYGRVHDPRWNALADTVNMYRSCMHRPGGMVWPTIAWPNVQHQWIFEQMIAHTTRAGVNYTGGGCGYIYWREPYINAAVEDPLMVQIFNRHDQPWAPQWNLPEIPLDSDSFTTGDFTTTYADFLANVPPLVAP